MADSFLKENEELRGVINSGHTRQSAYVIRTVGDDHEPRQFSTWSAKAISGIGHVAETIMDRAVVLELRRKLPGESVQRLRHAEPGLFDRLASKIARFADDAGTAIERARPELPEALNDRAQDNWEPLLAIADLAGEALHLAWVFHFVGQEPETAVFMAPVNYRQALKMYPCAIAAIPFTLTVEASCETCRHRRRPGGYPAPFLCGARADLPPAYGDGPPLRQLPDDNGAGCDLWKGRNHG